MITDYTAQAEDVDNPVVPNYLTEFFNAKTFLQTASSQSGDNLYDHLSEVLNKILAERPQNVIDFFEEYSKRVKEQRFRPKTDHLEDIYVPAGRLNVSSKMLPMLRPLPPAEPSTVDPADLELADMSHNNMLELLFYLEHCGLGQPRMEMFFVMLSIRNLVHSEPVSFIRFWGKVFGTLSNYLVVECELKEEEYMKKNEAYQKELEEIKPPTAEEARKELLPGYIADDEIPRALRNIAREQNFFGEGSKYPRPLPAEPKVEYERLPEAPPEPSGVGVNKKVYYVCNGVGRPWIMLPDVTPQQIFVARQIYKSFTGNLEENICTFPEFPGKEKEYLRAQIARISAGTQISPLGYYTFGKGDAGEGDEEEDEGEEEAGGDTKTSYRLNPKYDPPPLKDLLDGSMSFWVHHMSYILPQGRTTWWNPNPMPDVQDEEMDEEMGEEEETEQAKPKGDRIEPETGPPLLTPLSEDATLEAVPAWVVRTSSHIFDNFAIAMVRSNLWPGAYALSTQGKMFQNVYLGFGVKFLAQNFSPTPLPAVQQEYPIGPEIMEIMDPTGADEEKWRIDHLPKPKPIAVGGEEGELEEPEEEEEEEEDEDED